ncbi:hypothetical protein EVAR_88630_1 [Eumeta japonica]|uniref:Uncharacterized protein n=1 Tax=Eumeta variegata TaxID=151549 RepID=A0A4C1X009_EUMVA|nr:hypothetical protein EVAR_88630_1 [Eumeta japonica]
MVFKDNNPSKVTATEEKQPAPCERAGAQAAAAPSPPVPAGTSLLACFNCAVSESILITGVLTSGVASTGGTRGADIVVSPQKIRVAATQSATDLRIFIGGRTDVASGGGRPPPPPAPSCAVVYYDQIQLNETTRSAVQLTR